MMPTDQKKKTVDGLSVRMMLFPVIITGYQGLTVAHLRELRTALGRHGSFEVVKNTLAQIAAQKADKAAIAGLFAGPSAVTFITGEPVHAARVLQDFSKAHPQLEIRAGLIDGMILPAPSIAQLAATEPREVLLAKMAGNLTAVQSRAAGAFSALLAKMASLMKELEKEKS